MSEALDFLCAQAVLPRWVLAVSWIAFVGILVCERLVSRRWQDNWKAENEWAIGLSNERDYYKALAERRGMVGRTRMSDHDAIRADAGVAALTNPVATRDELANAIRGLQSTDHPSIVPLHDELQKRYAEMLESGSP